MKNFRIYRLPLLALIILASLVIWRCSGGKKVTDGQLPEVIRTNVDGKGMTITVDFAMGEAHNHPLMAIWLEDTGGKYIETLYVAESIGKGTFQHARKSQGEWKPGPVRRPAALPYWGHKRGIKASDGLYLPTPEDPMPDAVTGPTPAGNFILQGKASGELPAEFNLMLEINQSWDWNEYWTNSKYPDDENYKTSSQPAIVYQALIKPGSGQKEFVMKAVGHSHYSGQDGSLNPDLGTLTTALDIVKSIRVTLEE